MAEQRPGDRVPPHNLEAEAALLGAMLLDADVVTEVADTLRPEDFYVSAHRLVYEAILGLDERGSAVDSVTVKDELRKRRTFEQAGGGETLVRLLESVTSAAGALHHARIVGDCSRLRALIRASQTNLAECYEPQGDIAEIVDRAEQRIFEVGRDQDGDVKSIHDLIVDTFSRLEERQGREPGQITGVDTGFHDLNEKLDGMHRGAMLVIAARPSMGKTTFAMNIAAHAAVRRKVGVLVFSLEVSREQVVENVLCSWAMVNAQKMRRGQLEAKEWQQLTGAANELADAPLYIDDTPALSALAMRAKARRLAARKDIGLIVVDYLQLMTAPHAESRQHEITLISQALKVMARELNVPVLALSQLNRAVDAREDHRPRMSDLRESGSIEQDADVIMFLYREAYYKELPVERQPECEIIVGKHRNGPTGMVRLMFFNDILRFGDPARGLGGPPVK